MKNRAITTITGLLAAMSLLIIFREVVFTIVDKVIIPIVSRVKPDNIAVLLLSILFIVSVYMANGLLVYRKQYIKHPEHSLAVAAFAALFYVVFRFSSHYTFYGMGRIAYVDVFFATVVIFEILTYFIPTKGKNIGNEEVSGFVSDNPSKVDLLGRTDYAKLLIDKINQTYTTDGLTEGSMTILLNERYGAGKSTFFNILLENAKEKIRTCVFRPWQTADGGKIAEELLRLLEEQYAISGRLGRQLDAYSKLLSGSEVKNVLGFVSYVLTEKESLAQRYQSIKEILQSINDPLVVLVDDVDRLQADELLALLKLLRNGADFPNIIYIVAADKEAMSQMLEMKGIKDADEYLKKFFNFELLFPIDDSFLKNLLRERVVNTLTKYYGVRFSMPSIEKDFLSTHYVQYVFQSPRDVYRYINLLTYTLDLFKMYGMLEEVNVTDLLRLQLIQFISPMVYKVLRDEMDLLLNVRGYDGRVHLKEGYKDIIISRQSKKQIEEVLSHVKLRNGDKQEEPEDATEEELTLFGIPAEERPNREDIVSELLRELFYDTQNYQEKNRICYLGEYFKFFAGKYSKGELSYQYMQDLMNESNEETFEKTMNQAVLQRKSEFLIHKLKQYVEDTRIEKDIPTVLKRCITIEETVYRDWSQSRDFPASPKDYNEIGLFRPVYSNLFLVDQKGVEVDKEKIESLRAIYAENKKYAWLAESLKLPIAEEYGRVFIYGSETLLELKENLICRFITEELADHPFEREKIEAIPMLRELYREYWNKQFKEYVKNSSEPMAWLYMLLKPSGDLLQWNYMAYKNLVGEGVLDYYAKDFLGLELSPELSNDLAKIGVNYTGALSATNFGHHPFLVEAKKWWDEKVKNK